MSNPVTPEVSVVLPVFNAMPYLTATLESILAQDLPAFEILAVDDGSTDGSGAELDRFAAHDSRIRVIHQENSGWPGMPRNRGLDLARGRFVLCMDADDTLAPQALSALVEMADRRDADVVIPRFAGVGGRTVPALFRRAAPGDIGLGRALETLSPQKLFRREMIERLALRFPEGEVRLEDGIFVAQAYVHARSIAFCGREPLYFIALRSDGQNISRRAIDPENYVDSCRRIAEIIRGGVADAERAELLVLQFFTRKGLRFYTPERWAAADEARRATWIELHRRFLEDFVSAESDVHVLHPADRSKIAAIRAGSLPRVDALVSAEQRLTHTSRYVGGRRAPAAAEFEIAVTPDQTASLLREAHVPSGWRLRLATGIHRASRPFFGARAGRGISRRIARIATGPAPSVTLLLTGRRTARARAIPGRLSGVVSSTGELSYRFVVPERVLQGFHGDRVDLWALPGVDPDLSGRRSRVRSGAVADSLDHLVYTTDQGNLSLDLRDAAAPPHPGPDPAPQSGVAAPA